MRSLLLLLAASSALAQSLPGVPLSAGMHRIHAELAADPGSRMRGLMFRESMAPNAGMLFVFDETTTHCMWMKNTLIPLSVAFLDEKGAIVSIHEMAPKTENSHCAARPARYALEMNKGWFAARGIKPGAAIRGLEKLRP